MWETKVSALGVNTFQIWLDPEAPGEFRGKVAGAGLGAPAPFSSLSRMIILLDDLMDRENRGVPGMLPGKASFELDILFRQNYSWQGRLKWPEAGKEAVFHSVLELIFLLESAIGK